MSKAGDMIQEKEKGIWRWQKGRGEGMWRKGGQ
jgi:hypothetical protein